MKETNRNVLNYVMNDMAWKIDLPKFLKEIQECSKSAPYSASFNIVRYVLSILAERAIELNDPVLNIIMLNLSLYEGSHDDDAKDVIEKLRNDVITWLEKQEHPINYKEAEKACLEYRKMREECGIKDPVMLDEIEEAYYNGATSIQKPVWSDEDEENLQHCCGAIAAADYYTVEDKQDMIDWLKSLKE